MMIYESIKAMSIEELAEFLRDKATDYCSQYDRFDGGCVHGWHGYDYNDCKDCAIKYLESEVK